MASVASAGASPLSGYEFPQGESASDQDENPWTFVSVPNSAGPNSSVGFFPSPASATLGSSWGFVGHGGQPSERSSLPAASPLNLDTADPASLLADASFGNPAGSFGSASAQPTDNQFFVDNLFQTEQDFFATAGPSLLTAQFNGRK